MINLSDSQLAKFNEWKRSFIINKELPYIGATGGHFGLKVIFTSIGNILIGFSWNGKEIDLTEYENF